MQYFCRQGQELIMRNSNETLVITPWGKDSLRVRSMMMGEVMDERFALLEPEKTEVEISIEDMKATMKNGNITVVAEGQENPVNLVRCAWAVSGSMCRRLWKCSLSSSASVNWLS